MKSHVTVLTTLLKELGSDCGADTSLDEKYVQNRMEYEGEEFLTITLPSFEKGLMAALEHGRLSSDLFPSFRMRGGLPAFLSGFLRNIFQENGEIRPTTSDVIRNIRAVRQFCLFLSKFEDDCKPFRVEAALDNYVEVDADLAHFDWLEEALVFYEVMMLPDGSTFDFRMLANSFQALFGEYLTSIQNTYMVDPHFAGGHGPGAVAEKLGNNERYSFTTWTDRLEAVLPYAQTAACNLHDWLDTAGAVSYFSADQEPPVRVVTVPKTMKGPRVIAVEPAHMQYVQQGLLRLMTRNLKSHPVVNRLLGWTDQDPNRQLCRDWGNYATIDLKDASDRVSFELVQALFHQTAPELWRVMRAARSQSSVLPDGRRIHLNKYASMGSSLCFPVESMIFAAVCLYTLAYEYRETYGNSPVERPYSRKARRWVSSVGFRVFGDDIVFPKTQAPSLIRNLETLGLKVNKDKTFMNGKFRESCGMDWYDGHDVTVAKVRTAFPESWSETTAIIRAIEAHNRFFAKGLFETARQIEQHLVEVLRRRTCYVPDGSRALGLYTHQDDDRIQWRYNQRLQRYDVRAYALNFKYREDHLEGWGALRKFFLQKTEQFTRPWDNDSQNLREPYPATDKDHLRFAGRPVHVAMTVRHVAL